MMRQFIRLAPSILLVVAVSALISCAPATVAPVDEEVDPEPQEPLTIRLVHSVPTGNPTAQMQAVGEMGGVLEHYGTEYVIENTRIDASSVAATVLAAEEADIAFSATGAFIGAVTGLGADLRIVADLTQLGPEGHEANWFVVRTEDGIEEIADLRGRTLGTLGFGTFIDVVMRLALDEAGLDPERDVDIVEVGFPAMEAALREGRIDLAQMVPPFFQVARDGGGVEVLFSATEVLGPVQVLFMVGRTEFLEQNPRRVQAFFDDYYRFLQYFFDPENRDQVIAVGAAMQDLPPEIFEPYLFTQEDFYRDPAGIPNIEAIKRDMELLREFGLIQETIDIDAYTDLSYIEQAAINVGG